MKEIRIFLASSYELEPDRIRFGDLIRRLNDQFEDRGKDIRLCLVKWEDLPGFYAFEGQQAGYYQYIAQSDIFIALLWNRAGKHTKNEFNHARDSKISCAVWLREGPDSDLTSFEKQAAEKYFSRHPELVVKQDRQALEQFVREAAANIRGSYKSFSELEKQFSEYLDEWISENREKLTVRDENDQNSEENSIISFAETGLEFDHACIGDFIRALNQHDWNNRRFRVRAGHPDPEDRHEKIMLCLNCCEIPDPEQKMIKDFLDGQKKDDNSALPLLMMQREDASRSSEPLKQWYRSRNQYAVAYESVDSMLWKFMLHLLIHWHEAEPQSTWSGTLILKDAYGNDFPILDLVGIKTLRDSVEKLRKAETKLHELKLESQENVFSNEMRKALGSANEEWRKLFDELNNKIKASLLEERRSLEARNAEADQEYHELQTLRARGDNVRYTEKLEAMRQNLTPVETILKYCETDLRNLVDTDESIRQAERDASLLQLKKIKETNERDAHFSEARHARQVYCDSAYDALFNSKPLDAIRYFEEADKYYAIAPDDEDRVWLILKPLGDLYAQSFQLHEALKTFRESIRILENNSDTTTDKIGNFSLLCCNYCYTLERYEEAFEYAEKCLHGMSAYCMIAAYYYRGRITFNSKDYHKSLEEHRAGWLLALKHGAPFDVMIALYGMASANFKLKEYETAWKQAIEVYNRICGQISSFSGDLSVSERDAEETIASKYISFLNEIACVFGKLDDDQRELIYQLSNLFAWILYVKTEKTELALSIQECALGLGRMIQDNLSHNYLYLLKDYGEILSRIGENASALGSFEAAMSFFKDKGDYYLPSIQLSLFWYIGSTNSALAEQSQDPAERLAYYQKALESFQNALKTASDPSEIAQIQCDIGSTNTALAEQSQDPAKRLAYYQKALESFQNALKIASDPYAIAHFNYNIGEIHKALGESENVIEHDLRAERDALERALTPSSDPIDRAEIYRMIIEICEELGESQTMIDDARRHEIAACRNVLEMKSDKESRMGWYRRIGALYRDLREPQPALAAYDDVIRIIDAAGITTAMAGTVYNEAGHIRFGQQDFEGALRDCRKALQILRDNFGDDSPAVGKTERFIQEIREKLGEDPADQ